MRDVDDFFVSRAQNRIRDIEVTVLMAIVYVMEQDMTILSSNRSTESPCKLVTESLVETAKCSRPYNNSSCIHGNASTKAVSCQHFRTSLVLYWLLRVSYALRTYNTRN